MDKYDIKRRSISEAVYTRSNPDGDPFSIKSPSTMYEHWLTGLGVGLYWGEGTKANKTSVRLGNTDPDLIVMFIKFLKDICGVKFKDLRFGLQLFSDVEPDEALDFWIKKLKANKDQFYKVTVTRSGKIGTYRKKNKFGVLTIYYNNRKLRDTLLAMLPK